LAGSNPNVTVAVGTGDAKAVAEAAKSEKSAFTGNQQRVQSSATMNLPGAILRTLNTPPHPNIHPDHLLAEAAIAEVMLEASEPSF